MSDQTRLRRARSGGSVEVYALALDLLLFFAYFALFVSFIIVPGLSHITHSLLLHHCLFHFVVVFDCCSITCLCRFLACHVTWSTQLPVEVSWQSHDQNIFPFMVTAV